MHKEKDMVLAAASREEKPVELREGDGRYINNLTSFFLTSKNYIKQLNYKSTASNTLKLKQSRK